MRSISPAAGPAQRQPPQPPLRAALRHPPQQQVRPRNTIVYHHNTIVYHHNTIVYLIQRYGILLNNRYDPVDDLAPSPEAGTGGIVHRYSAPVQCTGKVHWYSALV